MKTPALCFARDESAVSSIEYALLSSLIAVVILMSVANVGSNVLALFDVVRSAVAAAA
jgi:pilus assembly protein Flp/PilA